MEEAIKYFTSNIATVTQTGRKFGINRRKLARELKNRGIDTSMYSLEKFYKIATETHKGKYDYSLVEKFKRVVHKVLIICPVHGEFYQDVYHHLRGKGCPACGHVVAANSRRKSTQEFITIAAEKHNNLYDYSKVEYVDNMTLVDIICKTHGVFKQLPNKHLQMRGCPTCAKEGKGWSKSKWKLKVKGVATLYIIKVYDEEEAFIKVGRTTTSVKKRFASKHELPYKYEILKKIVDTDSNTIWDLEIKYKRHFKSSSYVPKKIFGGFTECYDIKILDDIISIDLTN